MAVSKDIQKLGKLGSGAPKETVKQYEEKLLVATNHGHVPDIVHLLELGVNPNCCGGDDKVMPLHVVAARGDMVIFDVLYKTNKLDLNVVSSRGTPALIIGITSMHDVFVKTMAEKGANVNITDRFLRTPLHHSVFTLQIKMIKILLDHNCNRNPVDVFYGTPLSIAAIDVACFKMVKTLVEGGVAVNFYRGTQLLPLILELTLHCTDQNRLDICEYLMKNGIEMNSIDPRTGRNALHFVAISNNVAMAKLLLKH
nr:serine/threonine-protein phosphatase 6 regulatory ankyrin repeat subunit B-like [Onthophagus taurus]